MPKTHKDSDVFVYALSTCIWCKRAKLLLDDLGVKYDYVFMDEVSGQDKEILREELKKINPACSFPTIVAKGKCIVGYQEDEIKNLFKK